MRNIFTIVTGLLCITVNGSAFEFDRGTPEVKHILEKAREAAAAQPALQAAPKTPQIPQKPGVYTMSTLWRGGILDFGFSALEKLGVQAAAENAALTACKAAGNINCGVIDSSLGFCNYWECSAKAMAHDVPPLSGARYETVSEQWGWTKSAEAFSKLDKLGVEKSARDAARGVCQRKGLLNCLVLGSSIDACTIPGYDKWACTATATARGSVPPPRSDSSIPHYPTRSCFLAGTLIDTPGGARPIETIGLGDPVSTWDTKNNKLATPAQVTKLHRNQTKSHLKLTLTDGVVRTVVLTTSDHPFFLPDFSTAWAGTLKPDDAVLTRKNSGLVRVTVVDTEEIPGDVIVYNITVPPHHNYFANGILVHNR